MSDQHAGRNHGHERHHTREHLSHEESAQRAAHETALRLLSESRQLHVPVHGGPFQAIKNELPNSGDLGPATLAHMINQETGKTSYRTGESLPIPPVALKEPTTSPPLKPAAKIETRHGPGGSLNPYGQEIAALMTEKLNKLLRDNGIKP
jgi:hypothetical protein